MQIVGKTTLLLALLSRTAVAVQLLCQSPNCLFENPPPTPACVADGDPTCPAECGSGCANDPNYVTLGVRFITSKAICITGIQFYQEKGYQEFTTALWDKPTESNLWIGTKYYADTGWLSTTFPTPIPMIPENEFIAAYTASRGGYAYEYGYFNNDVNKGPVTFKGGVNGVYGYNSIYPGEGPSQNSNYFVTPVWKPKWSYYVWNTTSDTESFEIYDGFSGCIPGKRWNIEARPDCEIPTTLFFKLYSLSTRKVVKRQTEIEAPFFVWGNEGADVSPSYLLLPNGVYTLTVNSTATDAETITFTQACGPNT